MESHAIQLRPGASCRGNVQEEERPAARTSSIDTLVQRTQELAITTLESSCFSAVLSNPDLLEHIVSSLEIPDLIPCAQVGRMWRAAAIQSYVRAQRAFFLHALVYIQEELRKIDDSREYEVNIFAGEEHRLAQVVFHELDETRDEIEHMSVNSFHELQIVQERVIKRLIFAVKGMAEDDFFRLEESFMFEKKPHCFRSVFEVAGAYKSFDVGKTSHDPNRFMWMRSAISIIAAYSVREALLLAPCIPDERCRKEALFDIIVQVPKPHDSLPLMTFSDRCLLVAPSSFGRNFSEIEHLFHSLPANARIEFEPLFFSIGMSFAQSGFFEKAVELSQYCNRIHTRLIHQEVVRGMLQEGRLEQVERWLKSWFEKGHYDEDWNALCQAYLQQNNLLKASQVAMNISDDSKECRDAVLDDISNGYVDKDQYDQAVVVVACISNPLSQSPCLYRIVRELVIRERFDEAFSTASLVTTSLEKTQCYLLLVEKFLMLENLEKAQQAAMCIPDVSLRSSCFYTIFRLHFPFRVAKCRELFSLIQVETLPKKMKRELLSDMDILSVII